MVKLLFDEKSPDKLTAKEIILRGTIIAVLVVIPSLSAFFVSWIILGDALQAAIIGGIIHFIAMGFSLKISKKYLTKNKSL